MYAFVFIKVREKKRRDACKKIFACTCPRYDCSSSSLCHQILHVIMQFISQWMGEASRKRPAEDDSHDQEEDSRKRPRDDSNSGRQESIDTDQEYKIRGSSTAVKDAKGYLHSSASSRAATLPLPSPSPSIHPDRLGNIYNASPPSAAGMDDPLSLSMHDNIAETDEQRRK